MELLVTHDGSAFTMYSDSKYRVATGMRTACISISLDDKATKNLFGCTPLTIEGRSGCICLISHRAGRKQCKLTVTDTSSQMREIRFTTGVIAITTDELNQLKSMLRRVQEQALIYEHFTHIQQTMSVCNFSIKLAPSVGISCRSTCDIAELRVKIEKKRSQLLLKIEEFETFPHTVCV